MSEIITEFRNENTKNIDLLSSLEIVQKINEEDKLVALAVESELENIAKAIDIISKQFLKGGRLIYFGAGTSGRLGVLDASECSPTFSVSKDMVQGIIAGGESAFKTPIEGAEDNFEAGKYDARILNENDVAVVISASGNPKYLLGVMDRANEVNAKTIALTCNSKAKIAEEATLTICVEVGAEVIAGSSRMKAGTAQKMVLNMLSTGSMIKIGKTYQNFMIDLNPTNEKLKDRAIRIVAQIANTTHAKAFEALEKCNWEVKTAVVSIAQSVDIDTARQNLKKYGGVLRKVLNEKEKV
ncbi:N-acetylmuramic acid 6-phosphate etherase [bacterium]|nr:N-acetylmuramic acid 6-phosphate etherase [bacterium]